MSDAIIIAEQLTKAYGRAIAVDHLDLAIEKGEVFGLLGPNGAGKTTTILMLLGLTEPTSGRARIAGFDPLRQPLEVKRRAGYMTDQVGFYDNLSGIANLRYTARLSGIPTGEIDSCINAAIARVGLAEVAAKAVKTYSRGMRQRLAIAEILMKQAQIAILDEPTGGLDPLVQQEFYRLLGESRASGATVFLSSHILSEVEHVCDRVGILRQGRLIRVAELEELHDIHFHKIEILFDGLPPLDRLGKVHGLEQLVRQGSRVSFTLHGDFEGLFKALAGSKVVNFDSREPSLEEVFLAYYREDDRHPAETTGAVGAEV
jgi:ABC-2 type transport system ATP-binding protein